MLINDGLKSKVYKTVCLHICGNNIYIHTHTEDGKLCSKQLTVTEFK